jgi:hypothetical protein
MSSPHPQGSHGERNSMRLVCPPYVGLIRPNSDEPSPGAQIKSVLPPSTTLAVGRHSCRISECLARNILANDSNSRFVSGMRASTKLSEPTLGWSSKLRFCSDDSHNLWRVTQTVSVSRGSTLQERDVDSLRNAGAGSSKGDVQIMSISNPRSVKTRTRSLAFGNTRPTAMSRSSG